MEVTLFDVVPFEGYDPLIGYLLAAMQRNTQNYRDNLGRVGVDALRWSPFDDGHNIGAVLLHIADVEAYWIEQVGAGSRSRWKKPLNF